MKIMGHYLTMQTFDSAQHSTKGTNRTLTERAHVRVLHLKTLPLRRNARSCPSTAIQAYIIRQHMNSNNSNTKHANGMHVLIVKHFCKPASLHTKRSSRPSPTAQKNFIVFYETAFAQLELKSFLFSCGIFLFFSVEHARIFPSVGLVMLLCSCVCVISSNTLT